jgi:hypothetical protein
MHCKRTVQDEGVRCVHKVLMCIIIIIIIIISVLRRMFELKRQKVAGGWSEIKY